MTTSKTKPTPLARTRLGDDVAVQIAAQIVEQGLRPGDRIGSASELSRQLGVSRSIVTDELEALSARGELIERRDRSWVVSKGSKSNVRKRARKPPVPARHSLADQAASAILDLIIEGGMHEGDPLPVTAELARRYGVSLIVVREALASLAARGIIDRRQGRESAVARPSADVVGEMFLVRAHLDEFDTDEFLQCREGLEIQVAALAAAAQTPAEEKRQILYRHLDSMAATADDAEFSRHDLEFHRALTHLCGNRALEFTLDALSSVTLEHMNVTYQRVLTRDGPRGIERTIATHRAVADAVVAGDRKASVQAMTALFDHHASHHGG